jgi:hypothetical protein
MTVREQHIDFDIKLQKVYSFSSDRFLEQEKDWLLNNAQRVLLKETTSPKLNRKQEGADRTYKRYDDLQTLYRQIVVPVYIHPKFSNVYFADLPPNFYELRSVKTGIYCNNNITSINSDKKITVLEFKDDVSLSDLFSNFLITGENNGTQTLFDINDYSGLTSMSFADNENKFVIINHVLEIINRIDGIDIYWENFSTYYPSSFIIVTNDDYTSFTISWDDYSLTVDSVDYNYKKFSEDLDLVSINSNARIVEFEEIGDINSDPYGKTSPKSPTGIIVDDTIQLYGNNNFVLYNAVISYVKTPRLISLSLNQSCELSKPSEVTDIAVRMASAYINNDNHKNIISETLLND